MSAVWVYSHCTPTCDPLWSLRYVRIAEKFHHLQRKNACFKLKLERKQFWGTNNIEQDWNTGFRNTVKIYVGSFISEICHWVHQENTASHLKYLFSHWSNRKKWLVDYNHYLYGEQYINVYEREYIYTQQQVNMTEEPRMVQWSELVIDTRRGGSQPGVNNFWKSWTIVE